MLATIAMGAGMSVNFVVVAPLTRKTGLGEIQVAAILTLSTLLYAVMIPRWGRIADRIGRKRVMVFSLSAMGLTNMAFLFALDAGLKGAIAGSSLILLLVFVRLWYGVLSPGLQPASMAAMTDATTPMNRAAGLGMLGAGMSIGSILGPAGAAALAPFGALAPLWGSIVLCLAVGVLIGFSLPKTAPRPRDFVRPQPLAMTDPRVRPHLVFLVSYFIGVGMVQQTLAWFIEDRYRLNETHAGNAGQAAVLYTGIAFACMAVATIIVQFGYISRVKPDPRKILPIGLALVCTGYISADTFAAFPALCLSFLMVGAGSALAIPSANALGSLSVSRNEQGAAAALLSAAPPAGFVFGPLIGATLYQINHAFPLIASAVLVGVLAVYAWRVTARQPLPNG
ncbi:MAG: MFS transporter [Hyphomonas sp.]|nr:MFS transporter [Hyphomonas sp.]MBU3919545.1 MFS transporter [Alphaproteobacteria bacterium]MBU4062955.1 MFS transporter [Alphaproteobacteria bacterium]MBU4165487.1 MFS transporter [Alphaproteobacteria bacterium]